MDVSYIKAQMEKMEIDHIVADGVVHSVLEGERMIPILIEGNLYIEWVRGEDTLALFNFWRLDEIHYVSKDK